MIRYEGGGGVGVDVAREGERWRGGSKREEDAEEREGGEEKVAKQVSDGWKEDEGIEARRSSPFRKRRS